MKYFTLKYFKISCKFLNISRNVSDEKIFMKFYNTRRINKGVTAVRAPSEIWSGGVSVPHTHALPLQNKFYWY